MANIAFLYFDEYPEEANLIGRLVVAYGELEWRLCNLAAVGTRDLNQAWRAIFRARGEEARIQVADALIRPALKDLGLVAHYEEALSAIKWCRKIRNQYAHAHWMANESGLTFANMDSAAASNADDPKIPSAPISVPILKQQVAWFDFTSEMLWYLQDVCKWRASGSPNPPPAIPKKVPQPTLDSAPPKSAFLKRGKGRERSARAPHSKS